MASPVGQEVTVDAATLSESAQGIPTTQGGNDVTTSPTASANDPKQPQTSTENTQGQPRRPPEDSPNATNNPQQLPKQSNPTRTTRHKAKRNGMCFTCNSAAHKWYKCTSKCQWCQEATHPRAVCPRKGAAWYEKSGNQKLSGKQRVRAREGKVRMANEDAVKELREKCELLSAEVEGLKRQLAGKE